MLHHGTPILHSKSRQDINPLVGESQGFHPPPWPRVSLDKRVKCLAVASDSAIGLEVSGARREEPQVVAEICDFGLLWVSVPCCGHINSSSHDLAPQSDVAVRVGWNTKVAVRPKSAVGSGMEISRHKFKEFDRFAVGTRDTHRGLVGQERDLQAVNHRLRRRVRC